MQLGDVVKLGKHRLMCGDAGNPEHVRALFGRKKPHLVFTSPPYDKQRDYTQKIDCWDTLMQRVFGAMPWHERTQVLVNLGLVHRKGEWQPYWDGWIEWMRVQGWRRFGWYVWDKTYAIPQGERGRLQGAHEWVFHFCKRHRIANKTMPCRKAGAITSKTSSRRRDGVMTRSNAAGKPVQPFKIADSVIRILPEQSRGIHTANHPAVFPIALPAAFHASYTDPGELIYDPFAGSGTSILAAEQGNRICYAMEIAPEYCEIVLRRWETRK